MGGSGGGLITASSRSASAAVIENEKKFINNASEQVVLDAEHFAFYKGTIVIKVQAMDDNAFSFGIIFMGPNVSDPELVKHERGHVDQLLELGIADYLQHVVIPSTACFWMTEYGSFPDSLYHSMPWEYTANMYGGASFRFTDWAEPVADIYWAYVKTVSITSP